MFRKHTYATMHWTFPQCAIAVIVACAKEFVHPAKLVETSANNWGNNHSAS